MIFHSAMVFGVMSFCASAAVRSGKASVGWISHSSACEPGKPLQTAIRMTLDEGWHTYWLNPGEGGMKTAVEWRLPAGWSAGDLLHPVPKRFMTGDLPGFGYEGTVVFPVILTPPADFKGAVKLVATLSWLTCNDGGCVPGEAEVSLDLTSGAPSPGPDAAAIDESLKRIPRPPDGGAGLRIEVKPGTLILRIDGMAPTLDLSDCEVFPATPQVIDPAVVIRFAKSGGAWTAEVPKSEYAPDPLKQLTLVFAPKGAAPIELSWRAP